VARGNETWVDYIGFIPILGWGLAAAGTGFKASRSAGRVVDDIPQLKKSTAAKGPRIDEYRRAWAAEYSKDPRTVREVQMAWAER